MSENKISEPLGLISLNARGLGEPKKRLSVMEWLKKFHDASNKIVFLQETHSTERTETLWKNQWGNGKLIYSHGTSGSTGVVTILPTTINYTLEKTIQSNDGRFLVTLLKIDDKPFCLVNCYAPNKPKQQLIWLEKVQKILETYKEYNMIIGGDINDCFNPTLDRYNCKPNTSPTEYANAWLTICNELNLCDFWRVCNPTLKRYTWRQGSSLTRLKQSRIDYWIVSTHLMYNLEIVDIKTSLRSDHSLITIDFYKSEAPDRGPSFWHFNASLLQDPKYVTEITQHMTNAITYEAEQDKGLKWDLIKMEIRSSTICYSKNKAKETRDNIKKAILKYEKLEKEIGKQPSDEKLKEYQEARLYIVVQVPMTGKCGSAYFLV
jgi:exonuclease III